MAPRGAVGHGGAGGSGSTIVIGLLRVELRIPQAHSLKDKRRVVRSLLDRVSAKFNAAVAETGHQDVWSYAEVAVVAVSNDGRHVNSMLDTILNFIESHAAAEVADAEIRFLG